MFVFGYVEECLCVGGLLQRGDGQGELKQKLKKQEHAPLPQICMLRFNLTTLPTPSSTSKFFLKI
jgi:hypothetical protein